MGARLVTFLRRASLWGDEAMLALNIAGRDWRELARPLDYAQVAAPGFLWLERLAVWSAGVGELALRSVPLVAGVLLLPLLYAAGRRVFGTGGGLVALGIALTSAPLLRFSAELKPYTLDALMSTALLVAALEARANRQRLAPWVGLASVGLAAMITSVPAPLAAAAVLIGLAVEEQRARRSLRPLLAVAAVWGAAYAAVYVGSYQWTAASRYIREFWAATFLTPGSPHLAARALHGWEEAAGGAWWLALLGWNLPLLGLATAGAAALWRRQGPGVSLLLAGSPAAAFGASMVGVYPLATRVLLFAAPAIVLLIAAAADAGDRILAARIRWWGRHWLGMAAVVPGLALLVGLLIAPPPGEEIRPLVADLLRRFQPGEAVYVFHRATPAWTFYTTDWHRPDRERLHRTAAIAGPDGAGFVNAASRGPRSPGEGLDLVYLVEGRRELLGVASGVQARQWIGYTPVVPDPGWAENEADRIRRAGPSVWIVLADHEHGTVREGDHLLAAVGRAGGLVTYRRAWGRAALYCVRFPAQVSSRASFSGRAAESAGAGSRTRIAATESQ